MARVKRADYILTHYRFKGSDMFLSIVIGVLFIALLVLRYGFGYFGLEDSAFIQWLYNVLI
jgi:hypothetical protein